MRPYHPYTPDQAFLLPASLREIISAKDPVHVVRRAVAQLDLSPIHAAYRAERGGRRFIQWPWSASCSTAPVAVSTPPVGCRPPAATTSASSTSLTGPARLHTISTFRKRFQEELKGLFSQVLELCRQAGLVRLGHVSLDGVSAGLQVGQLPG